MKAVGHYLVFVLVYFGLMLAAAFAIDSMFDEGAGPIISSLVVTLVSAGIAVVVALRLGRPKVFGLTVAGVATACLWCATIVGIYALLAERAGAAIGVSHIAHMLLSLFALGGLKFAIGIGFVVVSPVFWLLVGDAFDRNKRVGGNLPA